MRNPERFFTVQFAHAGISRAEMIAFAADHEGRLASHNTDGSHDEMLAAISTAIDAVTGETGRELTAQAVQKARTRAKTRQREAIRTTVSRESGLI